jgi:hypothetical protein
MNKIIKYIGKLRKILIKEFRPVYEDIIGRELTDEEIEKFLINMLVYLRTIK